MPQCNQDRLGHALSIVHHIRIGEPQHAIPFRFQKHCPCAIISLAASMTISIQLDDQPFGASREVGNIGIYG